MSDDEWIINISCKDRPRIVATVTNALALPGSNISESSQFWDTASQIEQKAERVTHASTSDDLVAVGRDIEARVLARVVSCTSNVA